jgi:UDP-glucose 4-epimerase
MKLNNSTLLITGGTGSFGGAVLNRFIKQKIFREIRIFSRDEKKQDDLRKKHNNEIIKFYIGDVRDYNSVEKACRGVDYIFHAAALKQVPSCEFFPIEATKTNVFGTMNVIQAAEANGVKKIICLSTDKAAYPINSMGISKALMEKTAIAESRNNKKTIVCLTRYGNVMASRGSVIPLFIDQINSGKNLTITNPNMTRFLMTLDDAVDLVLFAFKNGKQGDLFVHKAPSSTIKDLAEAIIKLTGSSVSTSIIGTRHGEKLYETLCTREEMLVSQDMGDFYRVPCDNRSLNYGRYYTEGTKDLTTVKDYNSHNTTILNQENIIKLLQKLPYFEKF